MIEYRSDTVKARRGNTPLLQHPVSLLRSPLRSRGSHPRSPRPTFFGIFQQSSPAFEAEVYWLRKASSFISLPGEPTKVQDETASLIAGGLHENI
jgi:hypothetical protein